MNPEYRFIYKEKHNNGSNGQRLGSTFIEKSG